jgi:cation:H+ antiporter
MVFQGTMLPAIGLLLTPWQLRKETLAGIVVAFLAAAWIRYCVARGTLHIWQMFVNGMLYLAYILFMVI